MSRRAADWTDLLPRLASAAVMIGLFGGALYEGGWIFALLVAAAVAVMMWEAMTIFAAPGAVSAAILAGAVVVASPVLPGIAMPPILLAAVLVLSTRLERERIVFAALALALLAAGVAFTALRANAGAMWVAWLVVVVVMADVLGYFAGRSLGGPRFWPRVSPKKTWSGTVAGWVGAALVGAAFAVPLHAGALLVPVSVLTALAGQMGDIGESAVKRLRGIKDSSSLIPGHGGLMDRFDALVAATVFVALLYLAGLLPGAGPA